MSKTKTISSGSSTMQAMNDSLASLTAAAPQRTASVKPARGKGSSEPITYIGITRKSNIKKTAQTNTREDAQRSITSLRTKVAELYRSGKIKSSAALMVPLTHIDNATYYMCCGEFDQSVEICHKCEMNVLANY